MKLFSIKYKIQIAMALLTGFVLILYIFVARRVFENDKLAYVFDSNLESVKSKSDSLTQRLEVLAALAQAIALNSNLQNKTLGPSGQFIFTNNPDLQSFVLLNKDGDLLLVKEKKKGLFQKWQSEIKKSQKNFFSRLDAEHFLYSLDLRSNRQSEDKKIHLILQLSDFKDSFRKSGITETFLYDGQGTLVAGEPSESGVKELQEKLQLGNYLSQKEFSSEMNLGETNYLFSASKVDAGPLFIGSLTRKAAAFEGLRTLYKQSILFFVIVVSVAGIVSLVLAKTITGNLEKLTLVTDTVSKGNFDVHIPVKSKDEVGLLSRAFEQMTREIKRLLSETVEKVRMEGELKTAKAVQETLFPQTHAKLGNFEVFGSYESASECGGDWWFYQQEGNNLYLVVADATGHGASAALITSAARSAFAVLTSIPQMDLGNFVGKLNDAIYETSKGRVLMTAFICKVDTKTGDVTFVNASHEPPYRLNPKEESFAANYVIDPISPRLGDKPGHRFETGQFKLDKGMTLFIYTDGLPSLENKENKTYGERRMNKQVALGLADNYEPQKLIARLKSAYDEYRGEIPLNDDITLVALKHL